MPVNNEVKGNLAKLLATENLVIEHRKVSTASFDVLNRVLVLPIWNRASNIVYDLLVGHEVGHALYTPAKDWRDSTSQPIPPDYVNVIEDARIEKLMKRRYPGLAKSFYKGYSELNNDDFFSIKDEDVSAMSLIDRINLHFKVGNFSMIPFSDCEKQFVEMTEVAETFQDVLDICEKLVSYLKNNQKQEIEVVSNLNESSGHGASTPSDNQNTPQENAEETTEEDTDAEKKSNQENSDKQQEFDGAQHGGGPNEEVSHTQRSFDNELESLSSNTSFIQETEYLEIPDFSLDKIIVHNKILREYIKDCFGYMQKDKEKYWGNVFESSDTSYQKYKKESAKEVNYLVKEFECKKSADSYSRSFTSRTGVLDTKALHTYKYSEDLFKKVSVIPDGKNHGLIFILDWSGSMSDYLLDTVKQLLNLVWFCRKVQIPFEVYAFTYEWSNKFINSQHISEESCVRKDRTFMLHRQFHLLNFMSSTANSKDFESDCLHLWRLSYHMDRHGSSNYSIPTGLDLSGTPLNETIIALHKIIPMFKNNTKVQKVNLVVLTDGEANNLQYNVDVRRKHGRDVDYLGLNSVGNDCALRDRKTGNVYRNFSYAYKDNLTSILLENLKDNYPWVNIIGFRILSGSEFSHLFRSIHDVGRYDDSNKMSIALKEWRKQNSYEFNGFGYDALYTLAATKLNQDTSFKIDEDATAAQIGKAFRDMMKTRRTSKKVLSSFASLVS